MDDLWAELDTVEARNARLLLACEVMGVEPSPDTNPELREWECDLIEGWLRA
jgi:hypothetical protein